MDASAARIALLRAALVVLAALAAAHAARAAQPAQSAAVTQANLLESERFWPYRVALVEDWAPASGAKPLRAGTTGVLVRVEDTRLARIDFGRDGRFDVPVARTDLVSRAERIRRGDDDKTLPNFLMALGPRLVDPAGDALGAFPLERALPHRAFLTVFVDPSADAFGAVAKALAPLRERPALLTIVVPQGERPDAAVRETLRAAQWTVPFVYDHLAEPYTRSLLRADVALPALQLQTPDGRLLWEATWSQQTAADLRAALDAALGAPPTQDQETTP
ncbi:MAG: hypothetical protein DCC71_18030 [Proteobacteria bacterium]|nr:MAG: hypothetical protein DCC71_18030 [Pseudomonadota bacterium]